MPQTPTPLDPDPPQLDPEPASHDSAQSIDRNAPLSFIPHNADGTANTGPVIIRTGRYGELSEHELIHLLDSIEDERARGRFRESLYIAFFVWLAIVGLAVYGPHYLWHAPVLKSPIDALKEKELTVLNAPVMPHARPAPPPPVDRRTLEHLRSMEPPPAPVAPTAATPEPTPVPVASTPAPTVAPPPTHTAAPSPIIDAPTPQPSANRGAFSATESGNNLANAPSVPHEGLPMAIRGRGRGAPLGTGVEVLSPNPENVDFDPYLRRLIRQVYDQWIPLIPEEVQPPLSKTGTTLIRFRILPDGRIGGIWLDGSTHDDAINRAAWGAITGVGQFEPLPHNYHQPNLELRIQFVIDHQDRE